MSRIVVIFIALLTMSGATAYADYKYSIKSKADVPDVIYTINAQRSALPVYSAIPHYQRYTKLSIGKDEQQSIPLFIVNDSRGWWINGSTISNIPAGVAIDFSLRVAYLIPSSTVAELQGEYADAKFNYTVDLINDSYKQGELTDTSAEGGFFELVIVDAAVFNMNQLSSFTKILESSSRVITPETEARATAVASDVAVNKETDSTKSNLTDIDPLGDLSCGPSDIVGKPLINAASNGQIDLLNRLLKERDINETYLRNGDNALMRAIRFGQVEAAEILISAGIDLEYKNLKGQSALHLACQSGNNILVEKLLSLGANVNMVDNFKNTPLIYASSASNISIIELLLDKGADIDHVTHNGQTAIMIAARGGNTGSVSTLADMGANLKVIDKNRSNVLLEATYNGNERVVSEILSRDTSLLNKDDQNGNSPLQVAAIKGDEPLVNMFMDAGADVNHKSSAGDTVLISAIINGNERNILKILSASPNLLAKDAQGRTVYDIAGLKSDKLFTLLSVATDSLAIHKADIATVSPLLKGSSSEFFTLAGSGGAAEVSKLIYNGGNTNITDPLTGNTPIYSAIVNNNIAVLDKLIEGGADIDWRNKLGNTPLMVAVSSNSFVSVERLIAQGANPNLKNNDGNTPLIWAVKLGHKDLVKLLLLGGAKVTIHNNSGVTPLQVAISETDLEIEALLKSYGASY